MAIVYRHIRLDTDEIFYIGVGVNKARAYAKKCRNKFWKAVVKNTEYKVEITHDDICYEEALVIEMYLIEFYGRRILGTGPLVNIDQGGRGASGYKQSAESIEKRAAKLRGKSPSKETIAKIVAKNTGQKRSQAVKDECRRRNLGKKLTQEHKETISKSLLSNKNKPKFKLGKEIINIETKEIYKSMLMVCKLFSIPIETFRNRLNKNPKKAYPFKYLKDYIKDKNENKNE
jgi:hypothetical protein